MTVASIRYNNPGAMWGGNAISKRWGATANVVLHDGLGQGNTIANFPTVVAGGSAQFDLWRSSYCNLTLLAAIKKWSGGNSSIPYMQFLTKQTGIASSDVITPALLAGPKGLALMKAQSQWEAGQKYPMTDQQWLQAQQNVFQLGHTVQATTPAPTPSKAPTEAPSPAKTPPSWIGGIVSSFLGK